MMTMLTMTYDDDVYDDDDDDDEEAGKFAV